MISPKIGNLAPSFTLLDQNGNKVSLKDFKGHSHVILYFYPRAMTPGCTVQACSLRDIKAKLSKAKVVVLGVSPDPVSRLIKFQEKEKINFTLLSDENHEVAEKYGVWGPKKFMGKEYDGIHRRSFIIGADGKLKYIMEKVNTKTHHEDALALIKQYC